MVDTKVADLTIDEFRLLIKDVVTQTMYELLHDPDEGLALRPEIEEQLRSSLASIESGATTTPVADLAARLGLEW